MKKSSGLAFLLACLIGGGVHAEVPAGWSFGAARPDAYETGVEAGGSSPGGKIAFIRVKTTDQGFGTIQQSINAEAYRGKRLRLSGQLRSEHAGSAQMWMRVDGSDGRATGFDNMNDRPLTGDHDWQRCDIVLDVPDNANFIAFGFLLSGSGTAWADNFKLETVGNDVPTTNILQPYRSTPANLDFSE
jgi:hypothetical protein